MLNLAQGTSTYSIDTISFKNSQTKLFSVIGVQAQSADTSKYNFHLNACTFTNNVFEDFSLYIFEDVPTTRFDLDNINCIQVAATPVCEENSTYYDTVLNQCRSRNYFVSWKYRLSCGVLNLLI
jgi:hypothetical protein